MRVTTILLPVLVVLVMATPDVSGSPTGTRATGTA